MEEDGTITEVLGTENNTLVSIVTEFFFSEAWMKTGPERWNKF